MIEEALAAIRLYARFGSSPLAAQQALSVAYVLKKTGERKRSRILTEAADAISRAYAGHDAPAEPPSLDGRSRRSCSSPGCMGV